MKQNLLIILFILFSTFNYTVGIELFTSWGIQKEYVQAQVFEEKKSGTNSNDEFKPNKKDVKDEIKRRKNYHKGLVRIYNDGFDEKYLDLIEKNSMQLSALRKIYNDLKIT